MSGVRVPDSPPNPIVAPEARLNGLRFAAAPLLKWAASALRGALSRRRHYLFLTPPFVHRQRPYSKRSGRLLEFHVRDATDLAVMAQIYRSEDYDLSRLGRWGDIEACYADNFRLLARGEGAPFIVKIDIEGFEAELFSRNLEWLDRFYVLIIELHDWMLPRQRSSQSFLRAIGALDRDFLYAGENVFSIANR